MDYPFSKVDELLQKTIEFSSEKISELQERITKSKAFRQRLKDEVSIKIVDILSKNKFKNLNILKGREYLHDWVYKKLTKTSKETLNVYIGELENSDLQKLKNLKNLVLVIPAKEEHKTKNLNLSEHEHLGIYTHMIFTKGVNIEKDFYEKNKLTFLVFFMLIAATIAVHPVPQDDLLRHLKSWMYNYDYSNLYKYGEDMSFPFYPFWDRFYSFLDINFGHAAIPIIHVILFLLFLIAFYINMRDEKDEWRAVLILLSMSSVLFAAIVGGRPTIFLAALFLIGINLTGLPALLLGIFIGFSYYFFFVWLIPLSLKSKEYFIAMILSFAFWIVFTHGSYFSYLIYFLSHEKFAMNYISELQPIFLDLIDPTFIILLFLFLTAPKLKNLKYMIWFILLYTIRWNVALIPLIAISTDTKKLPNIFKKPYAKVLLLLYILAVANTIPQSYPTSIPHLSFENSSIFCESMVCMYSTVYNSKNITITPFMTSGMTNREILHNMFLLQHGKMNCSIFKKFHYDYVVESSLKEIPQCLQLQNVEGKYRIWKVKN